MDREGGESARRTAYDMNAFGGFYEAIMAMMVVTVGVIILTASLSLLAVRDHETVLEPVTVCDRAMESILSDPELRLAARLIDARELRHYCFGDLFSNWSGGAKVILSYADGRAETLFQTGDEEAIERASRTEAVNVCYHQADVRAATLTVWVWT